MRFYFLDILLNQKVPDKFYQESNRVLGCGAEAPSLVVNLPILLR